MDLIWKGAVCLTIFHLPISYFWHSWRLRWYKTMKLQLEKETLWASSGRRCQKGMTGSEEVLIIFMIICSVINLLTTKLSERSGNPHGGWGLAEAKSGVRAEEAEVGRRGATWSETWLCSGSSPFPCLSLVTLNVQLDDEEGFFEHILLCMLWGLSWWLRW